MTSTRFDRVRWLRTFAMVLVLALVAVACGDDDSSSATDSTHGGSTDTAAEAQTVASANDGTTGSPDNTDFPDKITFGAVPAEESSALRQSYQPLIDAIEQELGVEVEFIEAADYAGIIEGVIAGHIDLAQFGPFSYVLAELNGAELTPIGAMIDSPDEEPGYQSYGIARADNAEINSIEDFAGRDICFVDPNSTSGFLYPVAGLIAEGIVSSANESDMSSSINPIFAGGHDASVLAINNGDCDAGFAFDDMVDTQLVDKGEIGPDDIKVVWRSEVIAGSPLAMSTKLPASFQAALAELVADHVNLPGLVALGICESEETCELTDENIWGYAVVDDKFYDGVRAVCDLTKAPQCQPS